MKRYYFSIMITFCMLSVSIGQVPQGFNYQAIARDATGKPLINQQISLKISLVQGPDNQSVVYSETHSVRSNDFGLINITIGKGLPEQVDGASELCDFSTIYWDSGNYSILLEMDESGGSDYQLMGSTKLMPVPYALFSARSGSGSRSGEWDHSGSDKVFLETGYSGANVGIGSDVPGGKLHVQTIGFSGPTAPALFIEHQVGYSSTFRRAVNNPGNALFLLQKARGSMAVPSAVLHNDNIGQIRMEGYNGTEYKTVGYIRGIADNPHGEQVPGKLVFAVTDWDGNTTDKMVINRYGYVGIGSTDPQFRLDIIDNQANGLRIASSTGGMGIKLSLKNGDGNTWDFVSGASSSLYFTYNTNTYVTFDVSRNVGIGDPFPDGVLEVSAAGESRDLFLVSSNYNTDGDKMIIKNNGNIGLGSTNPSQLLDVNGTVKAISFEGDGSGLTGTSQWQGTTDIIHYNGNVGIGTTNPGGNIRLLHVISTIHLGGDPNVDSGETVGTLAWYNNDSNSKKQVVGSIQLINTGSWWDSDTTKMDASITFNVMEDAIVYEAMRINHKGNVGIGTSNPARKFHINDVMRLQPQASAPSSPSTGDLYFDSTTHKLRCYDGSTWQDCW